MKYLIPILFLFPSLVFAVDHAAIQATDSEASMKKSIVEHNDDRVHSNNSRIQTLEADICVLFETLNTQYSLGLVVPAYCGEPDAEPGIYGIGDIGPAGGIVFYVTDGGLHGLEAAPVDQSAGAPWGCWDALLFANGTAIGTGAQNTADILAGCFDSGIAAKIADDYTLNGYDDWFLPSKDELNQMYEQRAVLDGFTTAYFWSSSEAFAVAAYGQDFNDGSVFIGDKNNMTGVRAIRAF